MAGSRANWEYMQEGFDKDASDRVKRKDSGEETLIDKIPGDKGSTVDKIRERNAKTKKAIDEQTE